jgi:hypothetical protein
MGKAEFGKAEFGKAEFGKAEFGKAVAAFHVVNAEYDEAFAREAGWRGK